MTANRLQNIVITLDKVKMVLAAPGQSQGPAIYLLSDAEVLDHLWHGEIVVHLGGDVGQSFVPWRMVGLWERIRVKNLEGDRQLVAMLCQVAVSQLLSISPAPLHDDLRPPFHTQLTQSRQRHSQVRAAWVSGRCRV